MKISDEVMFLEKAFDVLNERYFESALHKIAITIQSTPRAHGHFTPWDSWNDNGDMIKEINIGAESLQRSVPEIIATLLHEMVHYYCHVNKIKDTSRSGTYHNKRFKTEAEKRGLIINKANGIGYSVTEPSAELIMLVSEKGWDSELNLYRTRFNKFKSFKTDMGETEDKEDTRKKSSTRKYVCPNCGMSVRATRTVKIACVECGNTPMIEEGTR